LFTYRTRLSGGCRRPHTAQGRADPSMCRTAWVWPRYEPHDGSAAPSYQSV